MEEFDKILQGLGDKDKFTDPDFKPDLTSYCKDDQIDEEIENYIFMRGSKMPFFTDDEGELEVDTSKASPLDVQENPMNIGLLSAI